MVFAKCKQWHYIIWPVHFAESENGIEMEMLIRVRSSFRHGVLKIPSRIKKGALDKFMKINSI